MTDLGYLGSGRGWELESGNRYEQGKDTSQNENTDIAVVSIEWMVAKRRSRRLESVIRKEE